MNVKRKVKQFFKKSEHKKYAFWSVALVVAMLLVLIGRIIESKPKVVPKPNKTTIYVKAPEPMQIAFSKTLTDTRLDSEYKIEFTDEVSKANFTVIEGIQDDDKLIAYSPIIAVFNGSQELYNEYKEKEIFVTSEVDKEKYDLDFKKVIDDILSEQNLDIKVYYPKRDSDIWEEFYNFLLFTVNDGYYPKEGKDMEYAKSRVEDFLSCKNVEPIYDAKRMSGLSRNDIYFTTYADFANLNEYATQNSYRIMYPKTVVYHNYYATFDKIGTVLYEALDMDQKGIFGYSHIGYFHLKEAYYNTKYTNGISKFMSNNVTGERQSFNGVEIPRTNSSKIKEEEK